MLLDLCFWTCAFGLVLFGRAFSGSFFWVRSFGRSFRGSFFGFLLLVVLFVVRSSVRAFGHSFRGSWFGFVLFGRSFRGSFFWSFFLWFVLLGARMCFLFDALKVLEACVARS